LSFYRASLSLRLVRVVALWPAVVATGGRVREFRAADGAVGRSDRPSTTHHPPSDPDLEMLAMSPAFRSIEDLHRASGPIGADVHIQVVE